MLCMCADGEFCGQLLEAKVAVFHEEGSELARRYGSKEASPGLRSVSDHTSHTLTPTHLQSHTHTHTQTPNRVSSTGGGVGEASPPKSLASPPPNNCLTIKHSNNEIFTEQYKPNNIATLSST